MPLYTFKCVACGLRQVELLRLAERTRVTVWCSSCGAACERIIDAPGLFIGAKDWREPTTESLERKHKKTIRAIRGGRP